MSTAISVASDRTVLELVTMQLGGQAFGIGVQHVHDVLGPQKIARVPLARSAVAGSINLRGRIVTVLDLRVVLGLGEAADLDDAVNVVIAHDREFYALLVDQVGDVLTIPAAALEPLPSSFAAGWRAISGGVIKLPDQLLLTLVPERLLASLESSAHAGAKL
jgi:purine-binding chemotaxis protein CheW